MKFETIKKKVAQGVYTNIIEMRDWNTMATILIDKMLSGKPKPIRHYETSKEYADFAWTVIDNWDVRMVGKLRELFPQHFPPTLLKGDLICDYDVDGDWAVYKK
jgi:hypothetical protein